MKKTILTLGMLCLLSLCGCAGSQRTADNWGITLRAEDACPTGVTLTCSKNAASDACSVQTGTQFWLERREGGAWTPVTPTEALAWTQEVIPIPENETVRWPLSWEKLYGPLPSGKYRAGKRFLRSWQDGKTDQQDLYAEFDVK